MAEGRRSREDLWRTLAQVQEWIRFGDLKAGATFALSGLLLGYLFEAFAGKAGLHAVTAVLAYIAAGGAALAVGLALLTVLPVTHLPKRPRSLIFFDDIAKFDSAESYRDAAHSFFKDAQRLDHDLLAQIWMNSRVAERKFFLSAWAVRALFLSVVAAVFAAGSWVLS